MRRMFAPVRARRSGLLPDIKGVGIVRSLEGLDDFCIWFDYSCFHLKLLSSGRVGIVIAKDDLSGFISRAKDDAKPMWSSQVLSCHCRTRARPLWWQGQGPKIPITKHNTSFLLRLIGGSTIPACSFLKRERRGVTRLLFTHACWN